MMTHCRYNLGGVKLYSYKNVMYKKFIEVVSMGHGEVFIVH